MGRVVAYMRVSTQNKEQKFDRQEEQLKELAEELYQDRMSGSRRDRPELNRLLDELQSGDTVYILSIDRLSRSTKDLLEIVEVIKGKGASLKSLHDTWLNTSSENPMSDFLLTVMGALAEMERKTTLIRINEGIEVAKSKGVQFGRPKANQSKVALALKLYDEGEHTVKEISNIAGISAKTIYNKLHERKNKEVAVNG